MILIDTNVVIRHLTGDPPEQAARATAFLASGQSLSVPDVIIAETVYVLESVYETPRAKVAEALRAVAAFPAVTVDDLNCLLRAVQLYEDDRLHFAEAYLVARAERQRPVARVASFDQAIDRVQSVRRIEPDTPA